MYPSENWGKVQYPLSKASVPDILHDIQDGRRHKKQSSKGRFFTEPEHLFVDGVPLFKSSGKLGNDVLIVFIQ